MTALKFSAGTRVATNAEYNAKRIMKIGARKLILLVFKVKKTRADNTKKCSLLHFILLLIPKVISNHCTHLTDPCRKACLKVAVVQSPQHRSEIVFKILYLKM